MFMSSILFYSPYTWYSFLFDIFYLRFSVFHYSEDSSPSAAAPEPAADTPPAAPAPPPGVPVVPGKVTVADMPVLLNAIGTVQAFNMITIKSRVDGQIQGVKFTEGQNVEAGTPLIQIDPRPFQAALELAQATKEKDEASLASAQADLTRWAELVTQGYKSQQTYDQQKATVAQLKASIKGDEAQIDNAKLNLGFSDIRAPISGRLSRRMVDPGNLIKADDTPLTTIVTLDPMYVNFDIDERTLLRLRRLIAEGKIKSRQEAEVPVLVGLSDERDEEGLSTFPHRGTINFSDNKVDASTGTLRVRGIINNPKPRILSPGLFVRIRLPIGDPHRSILISEQAVGFEQTSKFVYVVRKSMVKSKKTGVEELKDVAFLQPIEVGSLNKGLRVVNKGLSENDLVVVGGLQRIRDKMVVKSKLAEGQALAQGEAPSTVVPPAH